MRVTEGQAQRLVTAGWVFAIGSGIHVLDHLRRGLGSISEPLYWLGNAALVVQVVIIVLLLRRHPSGPRGAAIVGFPLAVGFFAVHWLPEWSVLSDPIWQIASWTWFSWLASTAEILGALLIGGIGLAVWRRDTVADAA